MFLQILDHASHYPQGIAVFTRIFYPLPHLLDKIVKQFKKSLLQYFTVTDHKIYKFSHAIRKYHSGLQTLEMLVRDHTHFSLTSLQEEVMIDLVWNNYDSVPLIGSPLDTTVALSPDTIIYHIVQIFLQLIDQIAASQSGLVYEPYRRVFVNLTASEDNQKVSVFCFMFDIDIYWEEFIVVMPNLVWYRMGCPLIDSSISPSSCNWWVFWVFRACVYWKRNYSMWCLRR